MIFEDASGAALMSSPTTPLPGPPYKIEMRKSTSSSSNKRKDSDSEAVSSTTVEDVIVTHYDPPNPGPYPEDQPPQNTVRFTPVQIEAVRSGINPVSRQ